MGSGGEVSEGGGEAGSGPCCIVNEGGKKKIEKRG